MPRWPSDWLGLSPEASHTARVAGSHRTNGFGFSNTVEITEFSSRLLACFYLTAIFCPPAWAYFTAGAFS
ncbi:hypothetical protein BRM28_01215 [Xanthomonas oryzae pv. oryzae]|nr:hypothetical protein BRM28_01215 [Xanthomonas oryzae pv. oryzae]RBI40517.1 hypothetical protein BRL99_21050 [Xanthomonas oryzae pv. oryzae]RBI43508.1 hypothetical protein BRL69_01985 [Xanthomonas oryzae pv. oryzae]